MILKTIKTVVLLGLITPMVIVPCSGSSDSESYSDCRSRRREERRERRERRNNTSNSWAPYMPILCTTAGGLMAAGCLIASAKFAGQKTNLDDIKGAGILGALGGFLLGAYLKTSLDERDAQRKSENNKKLEKQKEQDKGKGGSKNTPSFAGANYVQQRGGSRVMVPYVAKNEGLGSVNSKHSYMSSFGL